MPHFDKTAIVITNRKNVQVEEKEKKRKESARTDFALGLRLQRSSAVKNSVSVELGPTLSDLVLRTAVYSTDVFPHESLKFGAPRRRTSRRNYRKYGLWSH